MPSAIRDFVEFCEKSHNDYEYPSVNSLIRYISYCYFNTHKTAGVVSSDISKIVSWWVDNGHSFVRANHKVIARELSGYRSLRPSKRLERIPIIWEIFDKIVSAVSDSSFDSAFYVALISMGYFFGGRPCEYTSTKSSRQKGDHLLTFGDFYFWPSLENAKEVTVDFRKSKSDKFGDWSQTVTRKCTFKQLWCT